MRKASLVLGIVGGALAVQYLQYSSYSGGIVANSAMRWVADEIADDLSYEFNDDIQFEMDDFSGDIEYDLNDFEDMDGLDMNDVLIDYGRRKRPYRYRTMHAHRRPVPFP